MTSYIYDGFYAELSNDKMRVNTIKYSEIDTLFTHLKKSTIKQLYIGDCIGDVQLATVNCPIPYLKLGIKSPVKCLCVLFGNTGQKCISMTNLTFENINSVDLCNFGFLLQNLKVDTLQIKVDTIPSSNVSDIICSYLFANNHIISLIMGCHLFSGLNMSTIKTLDKNTSLEKFQITSSKNICYINNILERNMKLHWEYRYEQIIEIILAMFPLNLPPYVMLWIIDWIYEDNKYSTHLKKINHIMKLYESIRKISGYNIEV